MSVDPALCSTGAPYKYAGDNPLNFGDPTGLWSPVEALEGISDEVGHVIASGSETVIHGALDVVAVVPYGVYYGSYELARGLTVSAKSTGCLEKSSHIWQTCPSPHSKVLVWQAMRPLMRSSTSYSAMSRSATRVFAATSIRCTRSCRRHFEVQKCICQAFTQTDRWTLNGSHSGC